MNISSDLINISSYPFPKRQILDPSKLREFARDNFKVDKNGRKFSKWLENTAGKGEIARYEHFSFSHCVFKIGQTFCFANWVQNEGSLSMFCIAPGAFIRKNTVTYFALSSVQALRLYPERVCLIWLNSILSQLSVCAVLSRYRTNYFQNTGCFSTLSPPR